MAPFDQETARKILNQVEFYFSDSNLPRDKFLQKTVDQGKDGMVSLALLCSFSRMRNYLGLRKLKREDIPDRILNAVAEILRKSDFLKVSDDGRRVGRVIELSKPQEVLEQVDRRTIAVSPFEHDAKIEDLESFFAQYGKVNSIRLPRHIGDKRYFCGTALVEFSTEGSVDETLKRSLVYASANLILTPKNEFDTEQGKMIKEFQKSRSSKVSIYNDGSNISYQKGLLVGFILKQINNEDKPKKRRNKKKRTRNKAITETSEETVIKKNEENNSDNVVSCDDLKDVFQRFGTVKHVDYTPGSESGYICFQEAETAIKAYAAMEFVEASCLFVKKNFLASLEPVNGEAERGFWLRFPDDPADPQMNRDNKG